MITYAQNKSALFNYEVVETLEAGLVLKGYEVRAIKDSNANLKGSYATVHNGILELRNAHVGKFKPAGKLEDYDPTHPRKLLIRKKELLNLLGKLTQQGLTLVPISLYSRNNKIKVELALVRGKKLHDKRETIKRREQNVQLNRIMKDRG